MPKVVNALMSDSTGPRTFIVANRLPLEYDSDAGWRSAPGGLVSALEAALAGTDAVWVGWHGGPSTLDERGHRPVQPTAPGTLPLVDVPLSHSEVTDYYDGFCNGALWPLYHEAIVPPVFREEQFAAYQRINQRFAARVAAIAPPDSLVWVHDYQLQLVPGLLRSLRPDLRIGFFLHVPFPSARCFDPLPWGEAILAGLLASDVVGFQTRRAADRFVEQVCQRRAAEPVAGGVRVPQGSAFRTVSIGVFPVGPPSRRLAHLSRTSSVLASVARLRAERGGPDLILLGLDRLDYTKGIERRIQAVTELLTAPDCADRDVQFIQVATPSRTGLEIYRRLRLTVEDAVRAANARLTQAGRRPIEYVCDHFSVEDVVALYGAADVMLVTPLCDGMNLVSKEYVASRPNGDGRLVLSRAAGAAAELTDAWLVDSADPVDLARGIRAAVCASDQDARARMAALQRVVFDGDAAAWATAFLAALRHAP